MNREAEKERAQILRKEKELKRKSRRNYSNMKNDYAIL